MGKKEFHWTNKNVNLLLLADEIEQFFHNNKFPDVMLDSDPNGNWHDIQAAKKGAGRTVVASRKALHIIIRGQSNDFTISVAEGEWGKNVAAALLIPFVGWVGLLGGLPMTAAFYRKVRKFIKSTVEQLENTATPQQPANNLQSNVISMDNCPNCGGSTNTYYNRQYCHSCKVYL